MAAQNEPRESATRARVDRAKRPGSGRAPDALAAHRGLDLPPGWCADEGEEEVHAKITIFTDVLPLPSHGDGIQVVYLPAAAGALAERTFPVPGAAPRYQASPAVWWKRIVGLLNSPYMLTLALDLDCLPRTGALGSK